MKEQFEEIFLVGGKANSLGRSAEVLELVVSNKRYLPELYECISHEDAWVRMRAIDTLEKVCRVHPDWLEPYTDHMLKVLSKSNQPSIQWHLAQIFKQIKLTDAQRESALRWLSKLLKDKNVDWIVSANAMDTLAQFTNEGLFPKDQLVKLLKIQLNHKSKAVAKRATKILSQIEPN